MLRLLILVCLVAFVPGAAVRAQQPAQAGGMPAAKATPETSAPQISPDDARRALEVLKDPQKRAQITSTLETIARTLPQAPAEAAAAPAPAPAPEPASQPSGPLVPNSLGAEVLVGASGFLTHVSGQVVGTLGAVRSVPMLWYWLKITSTDPWARGVLLDAAWRLALVLVAGLAIEWAIRAAVRRPILALIRQAPNGGPPVDESGEARAEQGEIEPPHHRRIAALVLLRRVPLVLGRLVLEVLPVLGFLIIGHLIVASALGGDTLTRLVLLAVIGSYALCVAILCIARMMLSPGEPRLRLLHISDDAAAYATRWTRRIVVVTVFGYAVAEVGLLLGLSDAAHDALLKAFGLVDHVFLGIIVIQQRKAVRQAIRAPAGATGPFAGFRNWLARIWHWLALLLLATLWLAWVVEIPHGYSLMLRYSVSIVAVLAVARLVQIVVHGALDRMLSVRPEVVSRYPGIETRLVLYHRVLLSVARALIFLAAAIALLQLWGLGALDWLTATELGRRLLSSLVTLSVTVLLALAVWEAVNAGIERHLARLTRDAQIARSARLRTLLPLLRAILSITILIVAGMMVLSQIGVNIGPLLAGAGIVGVAIGFGSQKLVQDLINGIFLLLENTMQVGDQVTVSGLSGTVENLSVRTIRLRAGDGSVHIIPFSSVTSVTNVNRGIGNASVNVCVAYHEDTDRVCEALKETASGMRKEPDFSAKMLSDLQLWGVDKVDGGGVTIAGQVVCTDSGRWSVQREFNRRMKKRFDELGIEIYNPVQRMVAFTQMANESAQQNAEATRP
ncbi:MAG TPA: mechanosensitive ion channel domain-containing protein [Acetobacteraceae bacterium]|jgi:small-conductance mechanosensitive channel|nr:mechanosensitive ion channel domain-containing protein [Acetobacteraceae bacterium]